MPGSRSFPSLVLLASTLACGRAVHEEKRTDAEPFSCSSDASTSLDDGKLQVLATGTGLRLEAVSGDGTHVAYTQGADSVVRDVWSVSADGSNTSLIAREFEVASLRFEGNTLLIFQTSETQPDEDHARRLLAWRPGDASFTELATDVDPGSLRASRDGRWLSIEANDVNGDRVQTAEVVLIDRSTLFVESIAALNYARARFSRDSRFLIFGTSTLTCHTEVWRHSLADGSNAPVACLAVYQRQVRWEVSPDSNWLVHLQDLGDGLDLARTPLFGGDTEILATDVTISEGKEFDVARGGMGVSFLRRSGPKGDLGLYAITWPVEARPANDDTAVPLVATGVDRILEHYERLIVYTTLANGSCDGRLMAVSTSDGSLSDLGPFSEGCDTFSGAVLGEFGGALLALAADRSLRFLPSAGAAPILLPCNVLDAQFMQDGRVLFSTFEPDANGSSLAMYDPRTKAVSLLLQEITGPFRVDPASPSSYFTTVPSVDETALVHGSVR